MLSFTIDIKLNWIDFLDVLTLAQVNAVIASLGDFNPGESKCIGFVGSELEFLFQLLDLLLIET